MGTKLLEAYDNGRFGPLLGVSDEGSAALTIAEAAHQSAKAQALDTPADETCVGVIIDGERMGSAGEVPIGPDEYEQVIPAASGRTFCSTNVGVRVNTRFHQPLPEFAVADAAANEQAWLDKIFAKFAPFIDTPDGKPRPLTVRLLIRTPECFAAIRDLVLRLEAARGDRLGPPELHRISVLLIFDHDTAAEQQADQIRGLMKLASEIGVPEVAVDGKLVEAARRRMSIQGLLNILDPSIVRTLLAEAQSLGVRLVYHYELDPESAARTVWTGLNSARHYGLSAAKYGLFPLKLEQQEYVVRQIQRWMPDWTAIPAFYLDTALLTEDDVFEADRCVEAARIWMDMVAKAGVKIVLFDCPDRITPHRLLRTTGGPDDPGVLSMEDVQTLLAHSQGLGLRVLWSGGIKPDQAFNLGRLGVSGIFTTGSTARLVPVSGTLEDDQQLAAAKEPTEAGVRRIHALVQGGYLCFVLATGAQDLVDEIETKSAVLIDGATKGKALTDAIDSFNTTLIRGWKTYWSQ